MLDLNLKIFIKTNSVLICFLNFAILIDFIIKTGKFLLQLYIKYNYKNLIL